MIKVYKGNEVLDAARLALKNRLYVSGWNLGYELKDILSKQKCTSKMCKSISLYFNEDKPVGVCVVFRNSISVKNNKSHAYEAEFFVRKSFRKRGIAKQLFSSVYSLIKTEDQDAKIHFYNGNDASRFLFNKLTDNYPDTYYYG